MRNDHKVAVPPQRATIKIYSEYQNGEKSIWFIMQKMFALNYIRVFMKHFFHRSFAVFQFSYFSSRCAFCEPSLLLWRRWWSHSIPNNENKWKFNNDTGTSSLFCSSPSSECRSCVFFGRLLHCWLLPRTNERKTAFNSMALCDARPRHSNSLSPKYTTLSPGAFVQNVLSE